MTVTVKRDALGAALGKTRGLIKPALKMPIASCCKLSAENNRLAITATDLNMQATVVIDCEIDGKLEIAVDAMALSAFVNKLHKGADVSINEKGEIICLRNKGTISPLPVDHFPEPQSGETRVSFSLDPSQVIHLLKTPSVSADTNTIKMYLCGVYLHCQSGTMFGTASDGLTVIRSKATVKAPSFDPIIIPTAAITALAGMVGQDAIEVEIRGGSISFHDGSFHLISGLINENAISFETILRDDFEHSASVDRIELIEAIGRVGCMTEHQDHLIKVKLNGGPMKIESAVSGNKSASAEIDCSHSGDDITLGFNAKQLDMMARVMTCETIDILYGGSARTMSVMDASFQGQTIITPVRV